MLCGRQLHSLALLVLPLGRTLRGSELLCAGLGRRTAVVSSVNTRAPLSILLLFSSSCLTLPLSEPAHTQVLSGSLLSTLRDKQRHLSTHRLLHLSIRRLLPGPGYSAGEMQSTSPLAKIAGSPSSAVCRPGKR